MAAARADAMRSTEIKVGLFIFVLLVIGAAIIFAIGSERRLFERRITLYTEFPDVGGLQEGAVVRVGGVNVGTVTAVHFGSQSSSPAIAVEFRVARSAASRIHRDSVARIESMGLLGDQLLSVTLGGPGSPPVHDGDSLRGVPPPSIAQIEADAAEIAREFAATSATLHQAVDRLFSPRMIGSVARLTEASSALLTQVERGPGAMHELFYARRSGEDVHAILAAAAVTLGDVQRTSAAVRTYVVDAESQPGATGLLANVSRAADRLARASVQIGAAAASITSITDAVREENGLAHQVVYGNAQLTDALAQIDAAARDVRGVADGVAQGHGTIGALLVDPTLYEESKALVVNLRRNWLTRTVVRWVIKHQGGG